MYITVAHKKTDKCENKILNKLCCRKEAEQNLHSEFPRATNDIDKTHKKREK